MENIDTLKLKEQQLIEEANLNQKDVEDTLKNFLSMHCVEGDFDIEVRTTINLHKYLDTTYTVYCDIEFLTKDPERIEKGWHTDFGSDFDLDIKDSYISINKGTCGSYTNKDVYQVARDHLISNIWKNYCSYGYSYWKFIYS